MPLKLLILAVQKWPLSKISRFCLQWQGAINTIDIQSFEIMHASQNDFLDLDWIMHKLIDADLRMRKPLLM